MNPEPSLWRKMDTVSDPEPGPKDNERWGLKSVLLGLVFLVAMLGSLTIAAPALAQTPGLTPSDYFDEGEPIDIEFTLWWELYDWDQCAEALDVHYDLDAYYDNEYWTGWSESGDPYVWDEEAHIEHTDTVSSWGGYEIWYRLYFEVEYYVAQTEQYYSLTYEDQVMIRPCSYPTNFREDDHWTSNGNLYVKYKWDSSFGPRGNMTDCDLGEYVAYDGQLPAPSPPWPANYEPDDPTVRHDSAARNEDTDTHTMPWPFVTPYSVSEITPYQIYRFKCPCGPQRNQWVALWDGEISKNVEGNGGGGWRYRNTKAGHSAIYNPLP